MVQTRAQLKTTTAPSAAGGKPAAKRTIKSSTTASSSKPKSTLTKDDEPKPTRTRTVKVQELVKPETKPVRKAAVKPSTKAEPKVAAVKTQVSKSKAAPKPTAALKKSEPDLKSSTARSSRLGKPIKPKTKVAAAKKKETITENASQEEAEKPILPQSPRKQNTVRTVNIVDNGDAKQQEQGISQANIPTVKNIEPVQLAPPTPHIATFKASTLSPTKSLGSPIKPPVSSRPNRTLDSPKRASPVKIASVRKDPIDRPFVQGTDLSVPNSSVISAFKTSGLSPFKSIGTPIRRAFTSNLFSSKVSSTAAPPKRFATESPWRPMSAQGEKRLKLTSTPQRPRTADEYQIPNSCLRDASRIMSAKKCVSFQSPGENDGSPKQSKHVSKFTLATSSLPRLSEGQESESPPQASPEPEPLPLSEVLNIEFSPETVQTDKQPPSILKAVTFYVDIWGSDGSSANQYFIPLLEELGAKISAEWTDDITHVLFKDGDEKTLRRVAQSGGAIKCVNVGWALE
jgi:twin BRCT domain